MGSLRDMGCGRFWSSTELEREIVIRAALWAKLGAGPGIRCALVQEQSAVFAVDLLALWRVGACAVPLDPVLPQRELESVLSDCGARLILRRGSTPGLGASVKFLSDVEIIESPTLVEGPPLGCVPASADSAEALVLYTSGTESGPKGVVHTRAGIASRLEALRRTMPVAALERALCVLPLHMGHGLIGGLLLPLLSGGEVCVAAPFGLGSGFDLGALIDATRASFVTGVPALWRATLRVSDSPHFRTLRRVHCASAPLDGELRRELVRWAAGAEVVDAYGMTETASWVAGSELGETRAGVFRCGWGAELIVSSEDDGDPVALPLGREGRVWVRADSLMVGYLGHPELTGRALRGGWYRTADRGVMERDGALCLLGRLDDAINRAGIKVQPEEVESVLALHPDVQDSCAFGIEHPISGEFVAAAVVWRRTDGGGFAELERWCAERLSEPKIPKRWFELKLIPRTSLGKPRRREAAALCSRRPEAI
ncbi:MAG: class I adenylate-forming enzyme family protein [Elusimicrobiota bacterium]